MRQGFELVQNLTHCKGRLILGRKNEFEGLFEPPCRPTTNYSREPKLFKPSLEAIQLKKKERGGLWNFEMDEEDTKKGKSRFISYFKEETPLPYY